MLVTLDCAFEQIDLINGKLGVTTIFNVGAMGVDGQIIELASSSSSALARGAYRLLWELSVVKQRGRRDAGDG